MSLLTAGRALLAAIGASERTLTVQVLAPTVTANANHPTQAQVSWVTPTVTATVAGNLQPAGATALERVGAVGKRGMHELFTDPTTLTPEGRVRIASQQYRVIQAWAYHSHTHAVVEEVTPSG